MKDRVKELIENNTMDELAQMVVDLEAELSVKENMKIVQDCIKKDEKEEDFGYRYLRASVLAYQKEIPKLRKEIESLQKEVAEIKERLSDYSADDLEKQEDEIEKAFAEIRNNRTRPVKMTIHEADLSDMFDELTKSRDMERSEMPWFYDIFNPRLFK